MKELIEYKHKGEKYKKPERHTENEVHDIRIYCEHRGCKIYVKGREGYNGGVTLENGDHFDLRNQAFVCDFHYDLYKELQRKVEPLKQCTKNENFNKDKGFKKCSIWKAIKTGCSNCRHYNEIK